MKISLINYAAILGFITILICACKEKNATPKSRSTKDSTNSLSTITYKQKEIIAKIPLSAVVDSLKNKFGPDMSYTMIIIFLEKGDSIASAVTGRYRIDSFTLCSKVIDPECSGASATTHDRTTQSFSLSEINHLKNLPLIIKSAYKSELAKAANSPGRIISLEFRKAPHLAKVPLVLAEYQSSNAMIGAHQYFTITGKPYGKPRPYNYYDTLSMKRQHAAGIY